MPVGPPALRVTRLASTTKPAVQLKNAVNAHGIDGSAYRHAILPSYSTVGALISDATAFT
jgi:hypothetical protein